MLALSSACHPIRHSVSADENGRTFLWDLYRLVGVRERWWGFEYLGDSEGAVVQILSSQAIEREQSTHLVEQLHNVLQSVLLSPLTDRC